MAQISFSDLVNGVVPDASDFNDRYNALKNRINNGMEQDNLAAGSVTTAKIVNGNVTGAKLGTDVVSAQTLVTGALTDHVLIADASDGENVKKCLASDFVSPPVVVKIVSTRSGDAETSTTAIPDDDTIPTTSEGEKADNLTTNITPTSSSNYFLVYAIVKVCHSGNNGRINAFLVKTVDGVSTTVDVGQTVTPSASGDIGTITLSYYAETGATTQATFDVYYGPNSVTSGTVTLNGGGGSRKFGGAMVSSITAMEVTA